MQYNLNADPHLTDQRKSELRFSKWTDGQKLLFEMVKHLTTLNSGLWLVNLALLPGTSSFGQWWHGAAFASLAVSTSYSVWFMGLTALSLNVELEGNAKELANYEVRYYRFFKVAVFCFTTAIIFTTAAAMLFRK